MATHLWVDTSAAPLYRLTYPRDRTVDDVIRAHQGVAAIYEQTLKNGGRALAWIVDARQVNGATARERQIVAEHEVRIKEVAKTLCAGLAIVVPNALVRGLFTAITWVSPLPYPHAIFESVADAELWARARLAARLGAPT